MAAAKNTSSKDGDREDGVVEVKDADGRVHFTAKGSAAERTINAAREKSNSKGKNDAAPAVTES